MSRALLIAAMLLLLGGSYALYRGMMREAAVVQELPRVEVTTSIIEEEAETYTIAVQYPQFGIPTIDADIKGKIDVALAEFKSLPPNPPDSATPKHEFMGMYEDAYIGEDVVSVKLILSQYTGGAHPMTLFSGLAYDRATGRELLQNDAFSMVGFTADQVSARATEELMSKLGESFFADGANSNPENFSSFVVSEGKVTFIFQPYQVGPYAAGVQEVAFPRAH